MAAPIPLDATFRRAEGLLFLLQPCKGLESVEMLARRQGKGSRFGLPMADAKLLARLGSWTRADEAGVAHERLADLVERDCLFWSPARPERNLTGEPLGSLEGRLALRGNVVASPVVATGKLLRQYSAFPEMLRRNAGDVEIGGICLTTLEWSTEVEQLAFSCCDRHHRLVAELIVGLDGSRGAAELAGEDESRAILQALDDLGFLERHEPPRWDGTPRVTWMGHAGVLYEAGGRRILVDTIAFPRSWPSRPGPRPFDLRDLGALDAVLITHGDNDHFHPGLLFRLPRSTPIVIPRNTEPQPYQVDMRRILGLFGFERVIEVDEWERLRFGNVTVVATPFRGEDWGLTLDCRSYVVSSPELTIYLNADSISTPEAYDRIAAELAIDLAFLGVTGAEESYVMPPGFGYGDFYAKWIPRERHNQWIRMCNGPRESAEAALRLRARYAFGYAAGGPADYRLMYCDRGTHAELAAHLRASGGPTQPLELALAVPTVVPRSDDR
jgi:L-ascorbate metabolism protein UlaG (beta-lactamase superfamily)